MLLDFEIEKYQMAMQDAREKEATRVKKKKKGENRTYRYTRLNNAYKFLINY